MEPFRRRTYTNPRQLTSDLGIILDKRREIRPLMRGETLSGSFRERLMLAVTEVNQCRYCAYYHARQALVEGLTEEELQAMTEGDFGRCPPQERPGLLYAQHWAEADGRPDSEARERLVEIYGPSMADAIELALRVIRVGNLLGNTWDALLHRLSFGRWGQKTIG